MNPEASSAPAERTANAVLLIAFNRPATTRRVLEAIRSARPRRFYFAVDGPRGGRLSDTEQVARVRELTSMIDWPCDLATRFQEDNLGSCRGPVAAIDWFFSREEAGIILEDDCLPHPDFFRFCDWALEAYRDEQRVWQISGNNFGASSRLYHDAAVGFTPLAQVWGWASWRDRWTAFEMNPYKLEEATARSWKHWTVSRRARSIKRHQIETLKTALITWDFQWQATVLNAAGLAISCRSNLVTNIGSGSDATHTAGDSRSGTATRPLDRSLEFVQASVSPQLTRYHERKMGLRIWTWSVKLSLRTGCRRLLEQLRRRLLKLVFGRRPKLVVASTGRAGSTLLYEALSSSYARNRWPLLCKMGFHQRLTQFCREVCPRLAAADDRYPPILKTHDLPPPQGRVNGKVVFVYGDPLDSAASVAGESAKHGIEWFMEHQYHLHAQGSIDALFNRDVLNYEGQMTEWLKAPGDILHVRYEDLWKRNRELEQFCGFPIHLPARRQRARKAFPKEQLNEGLFDRLRRLMPEAADEA